jgi:hypothetical protein
MDYIICIPSYKRAKICREKTLHTLQNNKIDSKKIYVYVADKEEFDLYAETLDENTYNEIMIGIKGLVQQRQFIEAQWNENQPLVFIDDDVSSVDLSLTTHDSLDLFIKSAFSECVENKSFIWGIYPVFNPFFRKKIKAMMTTALNYICGAFYGIINRPKKEELQLILSAENGHKEDVERTLKYFITDGIVLRFNKIGFETKYYGTDGGGLGRFKDRLAPMMETSHKLKEKYGDYGKVKTRKNGMTEIVLLKIPKYGGILPC